MCRDALATTSRKTMSVVLVALGQDDVATPLRRVKAINQAALIKLQFRRQRNFKAAGASRRHRRRSSGSAGSYGLARIDVTQHSKPGSTGSLYAPSQRLGHRKRRRCGKLVSRRQTKKAVAEVRCVNSQSANEGLERSKRGIEQ